MPSPFPDTSRAEMPVEVPAEVRAWLGAVGMTPRQPIPTRVFFAFAGSKVEAPEGYAFNRRGDLINLAKRKRRAA